MNNVERFENVLTFKPVDRLPIVEWAGWWDKTIDRWRGEGLSEEVTGITEISEYLGLDSLAQTWARPITVDCPAPAYHGAGIITNTDEYLAMKNRMYPESVFDSEAFIPWCERQKKGETVVWFTLEGFFWFPRSLLGIERHMYAFYDQLKLIHIINSDLLEYNLRMIEQICDICQPTFMTFAEDMSYNHGPMLSKECFDEFLAPYYRRIVPKVKERGVIPIVDSDGDVTNLIPWLKEVGIEGILPLEQMAGVEVGEIRADHPDFIMIGAFDKTVMRLGEDAMRQEFERLLPTMKLGGFIPSVDHQTPPDVSLENYRIYVSLLKEYCEKAVRKK